MRMHDSFLNIAMHLLSHSDSHLMEHQHLQRRETFRVERLQRN